MSLHVASDLVQLNMQGWQAGDGRLHLLAPATASLEFTPAVAQ